MAYTFFLVYLTRDGFLVVAEYAGELGFWFMGHSQVFDWEDAWAMDIPSGPRLFDADGGGFLDDFFRLPMVQNGHVRDAERGAVQEWKWGCFDHHRVNGASTRRWHWNWMEDGVQS